MLALVLTSFAAALYSGDAMLAVSSPRGPPTRSDRARRRSSVCVCTHSRQSLGRPGILSAKRKLAYSICVPPSSANLRSRCAANSDVPGACAGDMPSVTCCRIKMATSSASKPRVRHGIWSSTARTARTSMRPLSRNSCATPSSPGSWPSKVPIRHLIVGGSFASAGPTYAIIALDHCNAVPPISANWFMSLTNDCSIFVHVDVGMGLVLALKRTCARKTPEILASASTFQLQRPEA